MLIIGSKEWDELVYIIDLIDLEREGSGLASG
jgi:hypothetical protein